MRRLIKWWIGELLRERHSYDSALAYYPNDTFAYARYNFSAKLIELEIAILRILVKEQQPT